MKGSEFALPGKVTVVTGSGQGIGKKIALSFAEAGANVVIAELNAATAEATAAEIRGLGKKALVICVDVRDGNQIENMVQKILDEFGRIDVLVNNAGGNIFGLPALEISEEEWDKVITLNLKSTFLCSKAVGRIMVEQRGGSIINIASLAGLLAFPLGAHYGAAKAAIINLTKTLSIELAPSNIRVNAICPGVILTSLTETIYRQRPHQQKERLETIPLGRLGQPEDVAHLAVFLASDASNYITGEAIIVGGGMDTFASAQILRELKMKQSHVLKR